MQRERPSQAGFERTELEAWTSIDERRAIDDADRRAIAESEAPRALVVELLTTTGFSRDFYSACAALGRILGELGASPTLAATTLDGALRASRAETVDDDHLAAARAAITEGYATSLRDGERAVARAAWEYPACAVKVDAVTVALTARYPGSDVDPSSLSDWAARVALGASKDRARYAIVQGTEPCVGALVEALRLIGIEVVAERPALPRWLRLPFRNGPR